MAQTFSTRKASVITMAEINVHGINDTLLAEWLNHPMPDVRRIAATEWMRRKTR